MFEHPRRRAVQVVATGAVLALLAAGAVACTAAADKINKNSASTSPQAIPSPPNCGQPSEGDTIVLLVSGTANEPRPQLTGAAVKKLQDAANSAIVDDMKNGKGSVAVIVSADTSIGGQSRKILPLTPRRADCAVEHGMQRASLIDQNVERIQQAVADRKAVKPGLDLLVGIDYAVRGLNAHDLIIVSNGMSTSGALDLRQVGWNEHPADLVAQLDQRGVLKDLMPGWHVLFTGAGATAGDLQVPLTKPTRDALKAYWMEICKVATAPGGSCKVDDSPLDFVPAIGHADIPIINVPGISSVVGPDGRITTTLTDEALRFPPDSAVLSSDAQELLRAISAEIAAKIAQQPDRAITIRGYVADPIDSTPASRQQTSDDRASAVSNFIAAELTHRSLSFNIDAAGTGTPSDPPTAIINGRFDENTARQMRKVTITY